MNTKELINHFAGNKRFDFKVELFNHGIFYQNQKFMKYAKTEDEAKQKIKDELKKYDILGYKFTINKITYEPF